MSGAVARVRGLFVEAGPRGAVAEPAATPRTVPGVAVLCAPHRARSVASGLGLALAHLLGAPCALAAAVGPAGRGSAFGCTPAAGRAAGHLRERDLPATATGRLVWLGDRRASHGEGEPGDGMQDAGALAAAASAELGRAASATGAPTALALGFARTAALDRVLAWHDAIVVVREPDVADVVLERALASLAGLGRPVGAMEPPARLSAALATSGLRAPAEALRAVAQFDLGRTLGEGGRDG